MTINNISKYLGIIVIALVFTGCVPKVAQREANDSVPEGYTSSLDSTNTGKMSWKVFFTDPNLASLIDTALQNNQELNIMLQEINVAQSEVRARKGEYLPFVNIKAGGGVDKPSRYTSKGASDYSSTYEDGKHLPEPLGDVGLGLVASWEIDIWKKLRNAKKAASFRYLASIEGKNFMVTHLVAEIAHSYYELMALDNQLEILKTNIEIQKNALKIVKMQKDAAKVTELAVRRFEAEVLKNQGLQFEIQQRIVEAENNINFLLGRFPQPIARSSDGFISMIPDTVFAGLPAQLLDNRPDIKQAEYELTAAKLDVKVAKAAFYPSLSLSAGIGLGAFNPSHLIQAPESMLYALAADLAAPLINRNAIKAQYYGANAKQVQAIYNYEMTILKAYIEVVNQLSMINNLQNSYTLKSNQVDVLNQSITISTNLFKSARADYMEVLLTQRDALESKMELVEIKQQQMSALVKTYQALGGGWN